MRAEPARLLASHVDPVATIAKGKAAVEAAVALQPELIVLASDRHGHSSVMTAPNPPHGAV